MTKELEELLRNLSDLLNAEDATLFLARNKNPDAPLEIVATGRAEVLKELTIPHGEGIAGWAFEHGKPVISNDAQNDTRFYEIIDLILAAKTKSIIAWPVNYEGRIIGVIEVINKLGDEKFSEDDLSKVVDASDAILAHVPEEKLVVFKE